MNVLINALSAKQGGGQTYLMNLVKNFPFDKDVTIFVLCAEYNKFLFESHNTNTFIITANNILRNSFLRTLFELLYLPLFLMKRGIDLYYQPAAGIPSIVFSKCRVMTTLQNMLILDSKERSRFPYLNFVRVKLSILNFVVIYTLRHSDKVIFISQNSQERVKQKIQDIEMRSRVIPHGLNFSFFVPQHDLDIAQYGLKENEFYLYVSIFDYYKAQKELVLEWDILSRSNFKYPLVLAGFLSRERYVKQVTKEIAKKNLNHMVIITGPIEHKYLPSFYHKSRALIFASSCECCPNILLEKMSSGKPLFVSQYPPMPEFGLDVPVYFDPYKPGDLASKVLCFESKPQELYGRSDKSIQLAKQFNWEKTSLETLNFMKE